MKHLDNVHWCEKCNFFEKFKDGVCIKCSSPLVINKKDVRTYIETIAFIPSMSTKTELVNDAIKKQGATRE